MKVREKKWIRFRIYVVATFFLFGLGTILARAYQLQVLEKDRLTSIAQASYIGTTKLPPRRGTIYDRGGHELAISVEVESGYAHPKQIKEKAKTARELSRILGERRNKVLGLLKSQRSFVWIKRRIAPNRARDVKDLELEGIGMAKETRRYYPGKEIASHLIGFAGADNQGLEGLERRYDQLLQGPQYTLIQMRNALGRPFSISRPITSGQGAHDLILTIDKDIQYKAQKSLKAAVERTRARGGHCIVIDPETGEILAMAVVPEFNPNVFTNYKAYQWRNRAVTDCFEPGSTIKAFLLAACLEERVVTSKTQFDCEQGKYKIGAHVVHDTHKYGNLSVSDIIAYSSNIGAIKLGQKLGYEKFCEYLRNFGFGSKAGVDLLGEREGYIRPLNKNKQVDRATAFFGQGMTTTSLQLAMAMAAIANGGKLMRPYVVKAIADESGRVVKRSSPKVIRRVLLGKTAKNVTRILEGVVEDEGTAPGGAINGFGVAGKTGTSQKVDPETKKYSNKNYIATFVGFAPADQPKLVILVVIDEPAGVPYGGIVAAPVFKEVGQWSLNHLRINPQIRLVEKGVEAPRVPIKSTASVLVDQVALKLREGFIPDFRGLGMREVANRGRTLGLKVLLKGSGLAISQQPSPGAPLKGISKVRVTFSPPP
jgi:cell division protein FtsI (penicillin-binding protein 3)